MSVATGAYSVVTVTETISVSHTATALPQLAAETSPKPNAGFTFTHGLLMGQLSVVIILFTFIRFFIFSNGGNLSESAHLVDHGKDRRLRKKQSSILRSSPPMPARSILARTYYNVETHPPESLDWLNVLVAQTISQFREDARSNNNILHSLDKILNGDSLPSFLVFAYFRFLTATEKDTVHVTELDIGEEFPIFSNCKVYPCEDDPGRLVKCRKLESKST
ncbi:uncharacterized protein V1513DRAFT_460081 [Lipomyces chichibuensis]|uniref:uncharacterized protein n=1 Tax=Lipomyces chichibuensis TaxID=1546026 RepID=UPI0033441B44